MPFLSLLGPLLGAGTSIVGGVSQARAARRAAEQQAAARERAAQMIRDQAESGASAIEGASGAAGDLAQVSGERGYQGIMDANTRGQAAIQGALGGLNPYTEAGENALSRLVAGLGQGGEFSQGFNFDGSSFMNDPGVAFRLEQGRRAREASAAAGRGGAGGMLLRELEQFGQNVASEEYGNAFNRALRSFTTNREATMSPLLELIGRGQNAVNSRIAGTQAGAGLDVNANVAGSGSLLDMARLAGGFRVGGADSAARLRTGAAGQAGDYLTGAGDSRAAGTIGGNNAFQGALTNLGRIAADTDWGSIFRRPGRRGSGGATRWNNEPLGI